MLAGPLRDRAEIKQDRERPAPSESSGKRLANRISNTSEEMAESAWRLALAEVNRRAHERK